MSTSRTALAALTSAAILGMSACGSGDDDPGNADDSVSMSATSPAESSSTTPTDTAEAAPEDGGLSAVLAAIEIAKARTGGVPYDVDELDTDGKWEIDLAKGNRSDAVEVASTGEVTEKAEDDLAAEVREGLDTAEVPIEKAITIAMKEVDGIFHDADLQEDNGQHHWEVSIDTADTEEEDDDHQIRVDVTDGRVTVVK